MAGMILFLLLGAANPVTSRERDSSPDLHPAPGLNFGYVLTRFYKQVISPVSGGRCPSLPTCSTYSAEAFKKHGFFIGWMMTVDRLIREGTEEARISPLIYQDERWKILDPVRNNDFWWTDDAR